MTIEIMYKKELVLHNGDWVNTLMIVETIEDVDKIVDIPDLKEIRCYKYNGHYYPYKPEAIICIKVKK